MARLIGEKPLTPKEREARRRRRIALERDRWEGGLKRVLTAGSLREAKEIARSSLNPVEDASTPKKD